MEFLASIVAPNSLAFDPSKTLATDEQKEAALQIKTLLQPGDIVLVTTAGAFYSFWRTLTKNDYDHVVVVLNNEKILHVGPPLVRTLPLEQLLLPCRQPTVLRPKLTESELDKFLSSLESLKGCSYDVARVLGLIVRLALDKSFRMRPLRRLSPCAWSHQSWICTDAILYLLADASHDFLDAIKVTATELDLVKHGSASFVDFDVLQRSVPSLLSRVHLPPQKFSTRPKDIEWKAVVRFIHNKLVRQLAQRRTKTTFQTFVYVVVLVALVKRVAFVIHLCIRTAQYVIARRLVSGIFRHLDTPPKLSRL